MSYQPLTPKTVVEYVTGRAGAKIFEADAVIEAQEVGDGNLNLVFILENKRNPAQALILKQALPYLRVAGDSWPLTRERMRFETQALLKYNELAPGLVPQVFDHDEEMSTVTMEFLREHEIMRKPLVARQRFPHFVEHISTFMARTLFFTSDLYLTGVQKKELQAQYINPHLNKIQEDFVFTNPFMESPENNWNPLIEAEVQAVRQNAALKLAIAEMKESYMSRAQALIHSDLHTGSIMLNATDTRVIDPEFAFYGPMGFDVGAVIENLILNYVSHYAHTPDSTERASYQAYLLDTVRDIWREFARKFEALWQENNSGELVPNGYWDFPGGAEAFAEYRRRYLHRLLQDVAGFGGSKMLRRMMGIVSVWDITSIADPAQRAVAERLAIKIGTRWVLERHQVTSIDDLLTIVTEITPA